MSRLKRYLLVHIALVLWSVDAVLHRAIDRLANHLYFSAEPGPLDD